MLSASLASKPPARTSTWCLLPWCCLTYSQKARIANIRFFFGSNRLIDRNMFVLLQMKSDGFAHVWFILCHLQHKDPCLQSFNRKSSSTAFRSTDSIILWKNCHDNQLCAIWASTPLKKLLGKPRVGIPPGHTVVGMFWQISPQWTNCWRLSRQPVNVVRTRHH